MQIFILLFIGFTQMFCLDPEQLDLVKSSKNYKSSEIFNVTISDNPEIMWKEIYKSKNASLHEVVEALQENEPGSFYLDFIGKRLHDNEQSAFKLKTACTSIILRAENNSMWLLRNEDFGGIALNKFICTGHFYQNNTHVFTAQIIPGLVGIFHGSNIINQFAFSLDLSLKHKQEFYPDNYKGYTIAYNLLQIMITATSFESAFKEIENMTVGTYAYIILAGNETKQGIIIEKKLNSVEGERWLDEAGVLVQTNYDLDKLDPYNDPRKSIACLRIAALGNQKTPDMIKKRLLFKFPTLNVMTVSTTIIGINDRYYEEIVWDE